MSKIGQSGLNAESRTLKRLGLQPTVASGSHPGSKGDGYDEKWLVEIKSTTGKSFSVRLEHLAKIAVEAAGAARTPALSFAFVTEDGRPIRGGAWVMVPEYIWMELKDGAE